MRNGVQLGNQQPRFSTPLADDEVVTTFGDLVARVSSTYGMTLDPWQEYLATRWMSKGVDGRWVRGTNVLMVPRQNGKSALAEAIILYALTVLELRVQYTAHEVESARGIFHRLVRFFENDADYPDLAAMLDRNGIRRANGQESIELKSGAFVRFRTRTRGGGRGGTVDLLIIDEAQEFTSEQQEATTPMLTASPNPLVIMMGTSPGPGAAGDVLLRLRQSVLAGKAVGVGWDEWSVPDDLPAAKAIEQLDESAAMSNPGLGRRISIEFLRSEANGMDPEGFAREHLGHMPPRGEAATRHISKTLWDRQADLPLDDPSIRTLGVAVSYSGSRLWVAGAMRNESREVYAELVPIAGAGSAATAELATWLLSQGKGGRPRYRQFAEICIAGGPNGAHVQRELVEAGVPRGVLRVISTTEFLEACASTEAGLIDDWLTHPAAATVDDPLEMSVSVCDKKVRGTGWSWVSSTKAGDSVPLEAFSVAAWAARSTKKRGRRGVTIGRFS